MGRKEMGGKHLLVILAAVSSLWILSAQGQLGTGFVTRVVESGDVQALRGVIAGANQLNRPTVIRLTGSDPFIFDDIDNVSDGANLLPVIETEIVVIAPFALPDMVSFVRSGNAPSGRFFHVGEGGKLVLGPVDFENGQSDADGGAILVDGELIVSTSTFRMNGAQGSGGAIAGRAGSRIEATRCEFLGNTATDDGGAVSTRAGRLLVKRSRYKNNIAAGFGGAVDCSGPGSQASISASALIDNQAGEGAGGGHFNGCSVTLRNTLITGSGGDGLWTSADVSAHNNLIIGNAPSNCRVFGPRPGGIYNVVDDDSCGLDEQRVMSTVPDRDRYLDIVDEAFIGGLEPVRLDEIFTQEMFDAGLAGAGSPSLPGAAPDACHPIGLNGYPVVPPAAPCTPGPLQLPAPGSVAANASGVIYDPLFTGTGFNIIRQDDGTTAIDMMAYDAQGQPLWQSGPGYAAGPFLVFPGALNAGPLPASPGASFDVIVDPVPACGDGAASPVQLFFSGDDGGIRRLDLEAGYLTHVVDCPDSGAPETQVIQDGHSGGFVSDQRPLDRFTLFVMLRNSVVLYWLTLDAAGHPIWLLGVGPFDGDTVHFETLYTASGPSFPDNYDPQAVTVEMAGSAELTLPGCDGGTLDFDVPALGDQPGTASLVRDLDVEGTMCGEQSATRDRLSPAPYARR